MLEEVIATRIDAILPKEKVIHQAQSFLDSCGWSLEIGDSVVSIPKESPICVRSRSFIKADAEDVLLGDHYEAVVLIGVELIGEYQRAKYGVLRMYFNVNGEFVSEDRYQKYS